MDACVTAQPPSDRTSKDAPTSQSGSRAAVAAVGRGARIAFSETATAWRGLIRDVSDGAHARFAQHGPTLGVFGSLGRGLDAVTESAAKGPRAQRVLRRLGPRPGFVVGLAIVLASLLSGLATGLILTGLTPIVPTGEVVTVTFIINFVLILAMVGVIALQLRHLWKERQRQAAGSRLHMRIVTLFAGVALIPAVVLALFAWISLDRGLDAWFSDRTRLIVQNSLGVAEAYVQEHGQVLRTDAVAMARDLDRASSLTEIFQLRLSQQSALRSIPYAYLLNENGQVVATAAQTAGADYLAPPPAALNDAINGDSIGIAPGRSNRVAAIKQLETFPNLFLYVSRDVDQQVTRHLLETRRGVNEYNQLEARRTGVQVAFGLMYLMIALTLLLAAVWTGLSFANGLMAPIRNLITAAEKVSDGKLDVRVNCEHAEGDMRHLSETFNRMTTQLKAQRGELLSANSQLSERQRFIETVLSGVSAGVIGTDVDGRIVIVNRAAQKHLEGIEEIELGARLGDVIPEFQPVVSTVTGASGREQAQDQIVIQRGEHEQTFAVIAMREAAEEADYGTVITFDDITDLVAAERVRSYADFARRVAHEIKNPLTPIQLSAQRLKRKYEGAITTDRETFAKCTDTIVRQVEDIRLLLNNFSGKGQMMEAMLAPEDVVQVVREKLFLQSNAHRDVDFVLQVRRGTALETVDLGLGDGRGATQAAAPGSGAVTGAPATTNASAIVWPIDQRLIGRALINMVKNALEAIASLKEADSVADGYRGHIVVEIAQDADTLTLSVMDNGCGLPKRDRDRLVEIHVTQGKRTGTGIGLNEVKRIAEQHHGAVRLSDASEEIMGRRGAHVAIEMRRDPEATADAVSASDVPTRRPEEQRDTSAAMVH